MRRCIGTGSLDLVYTLSLALNVLSEDLDLLFFSLVGPLVVCLSLFVSVICVAHNGGHGNLVCCLLCVVFLLSVSLAL